MDRRWIIFLQFEIRKFESEGQKERKDDVNPDKIQIFNELSARGVERDIKKSRNITAQAISNPDHSIKA